MMTPAMKPNRFYRRQAWTALKPVMPIALLISLLAQMPQLIAQAVWQIRLAPQWDTLLQAMDGAEDINARLPGILNGFFSHPDVRITGLITILAALISPVLLLGQHTATLKLLRGEDIAVSDLFSRLRWFFRALGLWALVLLVELLWMLPGLALMTAGPLILLTGSRSLSLVLLPELAGAVLMAVLSIRAGLRYSLAEWSLADDPQTRIRLCMARSRELTRGRLMPLFLLMLFFTLIEALASVLFSLIFGESLLLQLTCSMVVGLVWTVWYSAALGSVYLDLNGQPESVKALVE